MINKEVDEKKVKALIHSLGLKYNLQDDVINKIVNSPYKFTREKIGEMKLDEVSTEEELNAVKTNFIYSYIGKYYVTFDFMERLRKLKEYIKIRKDGRNAESDNRGDVDDN